MNKTTKRLNSLMERDGKRITLRAFAEELGIGDSTLYNYLKGRDPKASFIKLVCQRLGCDANWLLGIKEHAPIDKATIKLKILANEVKANHAAMQKTLTGMGV